MRRLGLLALGILGGALLVRGQDGDELDRELDRLRALLQERLAQREPPADERVVLRTYEAADLCAPIPDHPQPLEDLVPSKYQPPAKECPSEPWRWFEIDVLTELIRANVEPESWEAEGAGIELRNTRLFVRTIPRVHEKIAKLLAWCRATLDRRVAVDVAVVPVREGDAALLQDASGLTPEVAARLRAQALGTVTLAGWEGQRLGGRAGREISYVQDYDVELAEGASIGDPIRGEVFAGCTAQVLACLDGGEGAILECRIELARIAEPLPVHKTTHGDLELPTKRLTRVLTTFWAPLGRTVVAGGCTVGAEPCVILVTVRKA